MVVPCEDCNGQGTILVIYPWTPLPQSVLTATEEMYPECNGKGVIDDSLQEPELPTTVQTSIPVQSVL